MVVKGFESAGKAIGLLSAIKFLKSKIYNTPKDERFSHKT